MELDDDWMAEVWEALPEIDDGDGDITGQQQDKDGSYTSNPIELPTGNNFSALEVALDGGSGDDGTVEYQMDLEDNTVENEIHDRRSMDMERRREAEINEAMEEVKDEWIEQQRTDVVSPRELRRWRNHLKFMDDAMKSHAKRRSPDHVLREIYRYAVKGHDIFKDTLVSTINNDCAAGTEKQEAERMLLKYEGVKNLNKYFDKALKRLENEQLEWMSDTTSLASTIATSSRSMTQQARILIEEERRKHRSEMKRLQEEMEEDQRKFRKEMEDCMKRETADYQEEMHFILSEKKKELERGKASTKSLLQENHLVRQNLVFMEQKMKETKQQNTECHRQIDETRRRMMDGERVIAEVEEELARERQLRIQQEKTRNEMEQELRETRRRYRELEEKKLFPDAEILNEEEIRSRREEQEEDKVLGRGSGRRMEKETFKTRRRQEQKVDERSGTARKSGREIKKGTVMTEE